MSTARDAVTFAPVRAARAWLGGRRPEEALALGAAWGRRAASLGGPVTDVARINLGIAFGDRPLVERERILFDAYANLGRGVAELALLTGGHRDALLAGVRTEGDEHVEAAEAASPTGGVLIVTAHFGTWDLYAAAMARRGHALTVVHRGFANPHVETLLTRVRTEGGGDLEELRMGPRAAAGLLSALRRGRKCILLLDQNARRDEGVFVPFFSRLACTRSAPALIAMRRRVPVLSAFGCRDGAGPGHVLRIGPPIEIEDGGDPALARNVARMTARIEEAIRARPEHWLWSQRRFRTRPAGDVPVAEQADVYAARRGAVRALRHWARRR